jgi:hypothetical protein
MDIQTSILLDVNVYLGKAFVKALLKLREPFLITNRCVTADIFFTSVTLAQS